MYQVCCQCVLGYLPSAIIGHNPILQMKSLYLKMFFLFLNKTGVVGTQNNRLMIRFLAPITHV